eukprot:scaffold4420_cov135-Skeletonema_dohrnii-CCMP3373.AAC.4
MVLKSSRKSSPAQQMKAFIKASPIKLRMKHKKKPPPTSSASPPASPPPPKPETNNMKSSGRSTQQQSAMKLNQLRSKYGIKPISLREERDEQHTAKEVDDGEREAVKKVDDSERKAVKKVDDSEQKAEKKVDGGERKAVKEVDDSEQKAVKEEQPTFDTEKMWMSVEVMTTKSAIALNPLWAKFVGGGESPFPPNATAEEKGLAVIAAFASYKALQAKVEQKAIAVEDGDKFCNDATSVEQMKSRHMRQQVLVGELDKAQKEKDAAKSKVMDMWSCLTSAERKAVGGLGEIEQDLFEGIEANVFLKLGKVSKDFLSSVTAAKSLHEVAKAFAWGVDDEAQQVSPPQSNEVSNSDHRDDKSPVGSTAQNVVADGSVCSEKPLRGKVEEMKNDDATQKSIPLSQKINAILVHPKVNAILVNPLLSNLKEKDDATQKTSSSSGSSLAKIGLDTLMCGDHDDATFVTGNTDETSATGDSSVRSENSLLTKFEEKFEETMACGDHDDATFGTEDTYESGTTGGSSVRSNSSLLEKLHETMMCIGNDDSTVRTDHISENSLCEEEDASLNNNDTQIKSQPDESLTPVEMKRTTSTKSTVSRRSAASFSSVKQNLSAVSTATRASTADDTKSVSSKKSAKSVGMIFPSVKQNLSAVSAVTRASTADDTKSVSSKKSAKSVGTIKSIAKSVGTIKSAGTVKSVNDKSIDTTSTLSIITIKNVDTIETAEIIKSVGTTETTSTMESVGTTVMSHDDDDQSHASNASTAFVYHSTVGEALSCQNWLKLFSCEDGDQSIYGSAATSLGETVLEVPSVTLSKDGNDDEATLMTDATLVTNISKKSEVIYHNAPGEIEVNRRSNSNGSEPAVLEDDVPVRMMAHSHKKRYEEVIQQRNFLTHAFIKCDDFFSGLFCCQENVETTLQKSEGEEWNECYSYCKKFLYQDSDDFVDEEAFIAWLNIQEAQAAKAENSLSKYRVHKLKSLLMPVATEQRRQYEELRFALDDAVMAKMHGIENIDYAIKKAAVSEFNKNYYSIMLKGENHDIVVQQVARIIEGLGFERSLPPRPLTRAEREKEHAEWIDENVHTPIDNFINYLKEFEIEIYNSDTELRVRLDKLKFSFYTADASVASYESEASDDDCSFADSVSECTKDTNGDGGNASVASEGNNSTKLDSSMAIRNKMFERIVTASP